MEKASRPPASKMKFVSKDDKSLAKSAVSDPLYSLISFTVKEIHLIVQIVAMGRRGDTR